MVKHADLSCLLPPSSPASASRGPFKTRARPGVGGKPRAAGEVFRNHNTGPNSPPFKTLAAYSPLILGYFCLFAAYSRLVPLICRYSPLNCRLFSVNSAYLPLILRLFAAYLPPICCLFAAYSRFMMFKIRFHECVSKLRELVQLPSSWPCARGIYAGSEQRVLSQFRLSYLIVICAPGWLGFW